MISVRFEFPRTEGTTEERLRALEAWARTLCERLNIMVDSIDNENKRTEEKQS